MEELNQFTYQTPKTLPVVLLLDTSGSMHENGKIAVLNSAVNEMLTSFKNLDATNASISVSIITFGGNAQICQELKPVSEIGEINMIASGMTPMGGAVRLAKEMIENKEIITSRTYRPTVVLVSDGMPNDSWEDAIDLFKNDGRSAKCYRMAMGIGVEEGTTEHKVLENFISNEERVYSAEDASNIRKFFKYVTMSVTSRTRSQNPNIVPKKEEIEDEEDIF
jgi:uncharacterized protein YegL